MNYLGAALRAKRSRLGLSLRDLSRIVGVSFASLGRIERNEGTPNTDTHARVKLWLETDAGSPPKEQSSHWSWFDKTEQRLARIERFLSIHEDGVFGKAVK
jgi:transcriptional regulator with XRE-family HTH domain